MGTTIFARQQLVFYLAKMVAPVASKKSLLTKDIKKCNLIIEKITKEAIK